MKFLPRLSAAFVAVALAGLAAQHAGGEPPSIVGKPAPEIETTDWIHGDGRTTLADFRGEVVLLEFWKTQCPASRSEVRHLVKLADEFGKKGLAVIALTGEDDRRTIERFLTHSDSSPNYRIAIGRAGGYEITRLPYAVLIGPDGKVLADGAGGNSVSDKEVQNALKLVRSPSADELEARAASRLAFAERFASETLLARAEFEFQQTAKLFAATPSGKKAAERLKSLLDGEAAAELAAQKEVAKLAGLNATFEHPVDRPKASDAESLAKRLLRKADEVRSKAPRAASLAEDWAAVFAAPWK